MKKAKKALSEAEKKVKGITDGSDKLPRDVRDIDSRMNNLKAGLPELEKMWLDTKDTMDAIIGETALDNFKGQKGQIAKAEEDLYRANDALKEGLERAKEAVEKAKADVEELEPPISEVEENLRRFELSLKLRQ